MSMSKKKIIRRAEYLIDSIDHNCFEELIDPLPEVYYDRELRSTKLPSQIKDAIDHYWSERHLEGTIWDPIAKLKPKAVRNKMIQISKTLREMLDFCPVSELRRKTFTKRFEKVFDDKFSFFEEIGDEDYIERISKPKKCSCCGQIIKE